MFQMFTISDDDDDNDDEDDDVGSITVLYCRDTRSQWTPATQ